MKSVFLADVDYVLIGVNFALALVHTKGNIKSQCRDNIAYYNYEDNTDLDNLIELEYMALSPCDLVNNALLVFPIIRRNIPSIGELIPKYKSKSPPPTTHTHRSKNNKL